MHMSMQDATTNQIFAENELSWLIPSVARLALGDTRGTKNEKIETDTDSQGFFNRKKLLRKGNVF
jgi:hypothetical protein